MNLAALSKVQKVLALRDELLVVHKRMLSITSHSRLLEESLKLRRPGMVLEFGVASGTTLTMIAGAVGGQVVHGFDSFRGLPEDWTPQNPAGAFDMNGQPPPNLPGNVKLHIGLFSETLPPFLEAYREAVSFVHIDCDLYSSARDALMGLAGRFTPGAILVFDEFGDYDEAEDNEALAFAEFLFRTGWKYQAIARCSSRFSQAAFLVTP